jgi:transketolase C-terminal domain/subunit
MFYILSEPSNHSHRGGLKTNFSSTQQQAYAWVLSNVSKQSTSQHVALLEWVTMAQPIELAALYKAMPNMLYIRPCDSEEAAGAFIAALAAKDAPSIISLSRYAVEQYSTHSSRDGVLHVAYVFMEEPDAD